ADALRSKQQSQQRAREMARELIGSILDIQMRQLEENGLAGEVLYTDIKSMRNNIDGLVEAEMLEVVNMLDKSQHASGDEREQLFVASRKKIRDIVIKLSVERQNLLKRLKTAEIAAQVKRLIEMQT